MPNKVGKRGRKHGHGMVGISQRPADVKTDFMTQCDWLVWHRLIWNNDTKVVSRILGSDYADYVEEMDDGECFPQTDWEESVRVVQFERKRTFDAGATPGLGDVERPELKSVSGDLMCELEAITEARQQRADRIAELRRDLERKDERIRDLERKDERIRDLERQLAEAQDLKRMADRFSRAMMDQVTGRPPLSTRATATLATAGRSAVIPTSRRTWLRSVAGTASPNRRPSRAPRPGGPTVSRRGTIRQATQGRPTTRTTRPMTQGRPWTRRRPGVTACSSRSTRLRPGPRPTAKGPGETEAPDGGTADSVAPEPDTGTDRVDATAPDDDVRPSGDPPEPVDDAALLAELRSAIEALSVVEREMLRHYRDQGPTTPMAAHAAVGGSGDRIEAHAVNRALRQVGLVEQAARGTHRYALPSLIEAAVADPLDADGLADNERERLVQQVEASFVHDVVQPVAEPEASAVEAAGFDDGVGAWPDA
jgi:hypothetical protein